MKFQNIRTGLAAAAGMLVLILDSRTAMDAVQEGIELCLRTLIPSLFPFFLCSILMTGSLMGEKLTCLRPVGRLCGIPAGAESLLLTALLGGYPVGAQNVELAYEQGAISKADGERMLALCNQPGPAFLFGVVGHAFDTPGRVWLVWAVVIVSALIVGAMTRDHAASAAPIRHNGSTSLPLALGRSISVMGQVCGWVILFRLVLGYLERWILWLLPASAGVLIAGALELSNGCLGLKFLQSEGLRFTAACAMVSFGGLCVTLQTTSAAESLSLRYYLPGKLFQGALSMMLSMILQGLFSAPLSRACRAMTFAAALLLSLIAIYFLRKREKNSSIPLPVGV